MLIRFILGRKTDLHGLGADVVAMYAYLTEGSSRFFRPDIIESNASPVPAFTSCEWENPNNGVSIGEQIHECQEENNRI